MSFKDHFSDRATEYARARPLYPVELVDYLEDVAPRTELAWEAGCGSGQFTRQLSASFKRVAATDASIQQLAHAPPLHGVTYHCELAEASALAPGSADLIVAAAAVHWFDLPRFYDEARRVGGQDAIVALFTYNFFTTVSDPVDAVLRDFNARALPGYWPPERRHVDSAYETIGFPFTAIAAPPFEVRAEWTLEQILGYVATWSGAIALFKAEGEAPFEQLRRELAQVWGDPNAVRPVRWPLALRIGRVHA